MYYIVQIKTLWFTLLVGSAMLYLYWVVKIFWRKTANIPKKPLPSINFDKVLCYIWFSSMNPENRNHSDDTTFGHASLEILKYEYNKQTRQHEYIPGSYSNNTYISFGPEDYPPKLENIVEELRPKTVDNYRDDLVYEERSPDLTFYFHTLDVGSMISKIKMAKESGIQYGLLGSITFGNQADSRWKRLTSWTRRLAMLIAVFVNNWLVLIPIINTFCFRILPASKSNSYSCVSIVFDVFRAGMGVSKLLGLSDELLTAAFSSKEASKSSIESSREEELMLRLSQVFRSFGYLTEAGISRIVISPDIFADFMKQAKCNEIKLYEIPSERKKFKEKNVEIKNVKRDFETEEWLPASDVEPKKIGRFFVLFTLAVIWIACLVQLLTT